MHDKTSLLVDHQDMIVLVEHAQWNVLRLDLRIALRIGQHDADGITGFHLLARLRSLLVHQDIACLGRDLYAVARSVRQRSNRNLSNRINDWLGSQTMR
jgi:hypothetical protein